MKRTNFLILAALAAVVTLTSCSKDNDEEVNDGRVRFTSAIAVQQNDAVSRAAGSTWANGDAIGIYMVNNGTTTVTMSAANMQYTTTSNGTTWTAASSAIYYPQTGAVDFIAYHPFLSTASLTTPVDVTIGTPQTATSQPGFDWLWAKATNSGNGYTKTAPNSVPLKFDHKLSKVVMNCMAGPGLTPAELPGMTVTIKKMNTKSTLNLANGALGTNSVPGDIIPRTATDGSEYDAIILPGSYGVGVVTVEFKLSNDKVFIWDAGAITFEPGKEHTYTVNLNPTKVTVTATINSWTVENEGSVVAE